MLSHLHRSLCRTTDELEVCLSRNHDRAFTVVSFCISRDHIVLWKVSPHDLDLILNTDIDLLQGSVIFGASSCLYNLATNVVDGTLSPPINTRALKSSGIDIRTA